MSRPARSLAAAALIGLLLGAAGGAWWQRRALRNFMRRGPDNERVLKKLSRELDLDDGQRQKVAAILASKKSELDKLHDETRARFDAIRADTRKEIGGVLKPEQQAKFSSLSARWEERHKRWWGEPGGTQN